MGIFIADGKWNYRSTVGGTFVLLSTQRLLALRVFAPATSGSFTIDTPNTTAGEGIKVHANTGFDWTPSGRVLNSTFTFSSHFEWFAEYEDFQT